MSNTTSPKPDLASNSALDSEDQTLDAPHGTEPKDTEAPKPPQLGTVEVKQDNTLGANQPSKKTREMAAAFSLALQPLIDRLDRGFTELKNELKTGFTDVKNELKTGFTDVKNELKTGFTDVKNQLKTGFENVDTQLKETNRLAAANYGAVHERVTNLQLRDALKNCKWVEYFSYTCNQKLLLVRHQQDELDAQLKKTKFIQLRAILEEENRKKLSTNTPSIETDIMCAITPKLSLENMSGDLIAKLSKEAPGAVLKNSGLNCPDNARVLLLGEITALAIAPHWEPNANDTAQDFSSITKYLAAQGNEEDKSRVRNFIFKMLQTERMVTAWRIRLTSIANVLFPLDNVVAVLAVACKFPPTARQIEYIQQAVPTVATLFKANRLIFVTGGSMSSDPLDCAYIT